MSRRHFYNLLTFLPIVVAMAFGISLWQSQGSILYNHSLKDLNISGYFSIPEASAQTTTPSNCVDPKIAGASEGRIYYNKGCQQFRMSKNGGAWEEFGGSSVWRRFTAPNAENIYNINNGDTYVKQDAIFGLSGIMTRTNTDGVVILDTVKRNLIYGAVSTASAVDNSDLTNLQAASLLKLQSFNSSNVSNPYSDLFSVRIDGRVVVGNKLAGKLIVPEICLPDESNPANCQKSWSGGDSASGGQATADKYWAPVSTIDSSTIYNQNLADTKNASAGGNVKVTRNLDVVGSVNISKNENDVSNWGSFDTASVGSSDVRGVWYDFRNSLGFTWFYDTVGSNTILRSQFLYYDNALVLLALNNTKIQEGKIVIFREKSSINSGIPEFRQANETGGTTPLPVVASDGTKAKGLNAVCSVGDPDQVSPKNYKIFAAGDQGAIWMFEPVFSGNTYLKHVWTKVALSTIPADVEWRGVECKNDDSQGTIFEVYFVGTKNMILNYDGTNWTLLSTYNQAGPDINTIWLQNRHHSAPIEPVSGAPWRLTARYYAAGTGGKIYYWKSHSKTPADVHTFFTGNTGEVFNSISGQVASCNSDPSLCVSEGRWVYFGGNKGLVYRANMTDTITALALNDGKDAFHKIQGATSTNYDITGITGNGFHIFVTLRDNIDNPRAGSQDAFMKYISLENLNLVALDSRSVDNWNPLSDVVGKKFISFSGLAASTSSANSTQYSNAKWVAGGYGSTAVYMDQLLFKTVENVWKKDTGYNGNGNITNALNGENVNLLSAWRPQNTSSSADDNSFIGGGNGVILRNGTQTIDEITGISSNVRETLNINGLAGYATGDPTLPYKVYATATAGSQSYIASYIGNKKFTKVDAYNFGLNSIWSNDDGSLIVAVGDGGNFRYCQKVNANDCDSLSNWKTTAGIFGGAKLSSVYGYGNTYFVLAANYIYKCTGVPASANCSSSTGSLNLRSIWVNRRTNQAWAAGINGTIYKNTNIASNSWVAVNPNIPGINLSNYNFAAVGGVNNVVFFAGNNSIIVKYVVDTANPNGTWDYNQLSALSDLNVYALAGADGVIPNSTNIGGRAIAVGGNGLGKFYDVGASQTSGTLNVAKDIILGGNIDAGDNKWGQQTDWVSQCDDGQFVIKVDVLLGKVKCAKL